MDFDIETFFREQERRRNEYNRSVLGKLSQVKVSMTAEQITHKLMDMAQEALIKDDTRYVFLKLNSEGKYTPDPSVVDMGWQLAKLGSPTIELMQRVYYSVSSIFGDKSGITNLEDSWNGVGFWQR